MSSIKKHLSTKHKVLSNHAKYYKQFCDLCSITLGKSEKSVARHFKTHHLNLLPICDVCDKTFILHKHLRKHIEEVHPQELSADNAAFEPTPGAENSDIMIHRSIYFLPYSERSIENVFCVSQKDKIMDEFHNFQASSRFSGHRNNLEPIYGKVNCTVHGFFLKFSEYNLPPSQTTIPMTSGFQVLTNRDLHPTVLPYILEEVADLIESRRDRLEMEGSGWSFRYVSALDLKFYRLPSVGGCLQLDLDATLKHNYGDNAKFIKPQITDLSTPNLLNCFAASVAASLCEANLSTIEQLSAKKLLIQEYISLRFKIKRQGEPFPVHQIPYFERAHDLAISVYTVANGKILPLYLSKASKLLPRINLLFMHTYTDNGDPSFDIGHFVLINELSSFTNCLRNQIYPECGLRKRKLIVCPYCLHDSTSSKEMESHLKACKNDRYQEIRFPTKNESVITFDYASKRNRQTAFIGFLDFEAKMSPQGNEANAQMFNCDNCAIGGPANYCEHSERVLHEQQVMSYSIFIINTMESYIPKRLI